MDPRGPCVRERAHRLHDITLILFSDKQTDQQDMDVTGSISAYAIIRTEIEHLRVENSELVTRVENEGRARLELEQKMRQLEEKRSMEKLKAEKTIQRLEKDLSIANEGLVRLRSACGLARAQIEREESIKKKLVATIEKSGKAHQENVQEKVAEAIETSEKSLAKCRQEVENFRMQSLLLTSQLNGKEEKLKAHVIEIKRCEKSLEEALQENAQLREYIKQQSSKAKKCKPLQEKNDLLQQRVSQLQKTLHNIEVSSTAEKEYNGRVIDAMKAERADLRAKLDACSSEVNALRPLCAEMSLEVEKSGESLANSSAVIAWLLHLSKNTEGTTSLLEELRAKSEVLLDN